MFVVNSPFKVAGNATSRLCCLSAVAGAADVGRHWLSGAAISHARRISALVPTGQAVTIAEHPRALLQVAFINTVDNLERAISGCVAWTHGSWAKMRSMHGTGLTWLQFLGAWCHAAAHGITQLAPVLIWLLTSTLAVISSAAFGYIWAIFAGRAARWYVPPTCTSSRPDMTWDCR